MSEELKVKKIDQVALAMYGENFTKYMKVGELVDSIPSFKEFYYQERIKNPNGNTFEIIRKFNEEACYPANTKFHPYPTQYRQWRKKWDRDILSQKLGTDVVIYEPKNIRQVIKTRKDGELVLGMPQDSELEAGVRSLAGELINDAAQMLRDDQELEDIYTSEELMKRRAYITNVFAHTTKLVHGKAALMLKASQEKRENASFLMNLLAKATTGNMTDEQLEALGTTYTQAPQTNEQPVQL